MLRNVAHRGAFWSLIVARVVYAVNWYNIASIFAPMAIELKTGVSGLGILASSFFFGLVLFQIPGGLLAAKYGPRRTSFVGIFVASVSALLTGFSSGLGEAAALRFIVGLGMALFFSPGVSLIARYYREGSEGFGIGLYNSAFDLGGALGLFGWALLAEVLGWRQSLFFSGGMGIVTSFLIIVLIPKEDLSGDSPLKLKELSDVLLNRELIILSLNMLGQNVGSILVGSFIVYYLETALGVGYELAGFAGALFLLMMLAFSPISGRIYDRLKDARRLMLVSGLVMSAGVGLAAFGGVYGAFAATIIVGISAGLGFTVGFAAARKTNKSQAKYESLAIAWANSISLSAGFWSPVLFSLVVSSSGYPPAWLLGSLLTLAFVLSILALKTKARAESR